MCASIKWWGLSDTKIFRRNMSVQRESQVSPSDLSDSIPMCLHIDGFIIVTLICNSHWQKFPANERYHEMWPAEIAFKPLMQNGILFAVILSLKSQCRLWQLRKMSVFSGKEYLAKDSKSNLKSSTLFQRCVTMHIPPNMKCDHLA